MYQCDRKKYPHVSFFILLCQIALKLVYFSCIYLFVFGKNWNYQEDSPGF